MTVSEEAKKVAMDYLQKLLGGLEKGVDFAQEQIPLVAYEIIAYGRATYTVAYVLMIAVMVASVLLAKKFWRMTDSIEDTADQFPCRIGIIGVYAIINGITITNIMCNLNVLIKCWVAPRLYLIEYLHTLTK